MCIETKSQCKRPMQLILISLDTLLMEWWAAFENGKN
eukprot:CAMPEP_0172458496 /NCGR_PEP_ID=MMETSP1065-20121228/27844_1 /TAXON_ID=265537 /ORGANISM="Amphiprora paludosa, Strain CCMP125" /LENGTH=36 /DNA_ID= /DNA_START= /DNA_END= /DNA_ORIENTATION=